MCLCLDSLWTCFLLEVIPPCSRRGYRLLPGVLSCGHFHSQGNYYAKLGTDYFSFCGTLLLGQGPSLHRSLLHSRGLSLCLAHSVSSVNICSKVTSFQEIPPGPVSPLCGVWNYLVASIYTIRQAVPEFMEQKGRWPNYNAKIRVIGNQFKMQWEGRGKRRVG